MEKETLQKIYNLKHIKPDEGFVKDVKQNIITSQAKESAQQNGLVAFLTSPVLQNNSAVVMSGFAFLLVFGLLSFPLLPSPYEPQESPSTIERVAVSTETEEEEETEVPDEGASVEVAQQSEVERRFDSVEESMRSVTRQVLGTIISEKESKPEDQVTDEDIARHIVAGLQGEEQDAGKGGIGIMSVPEPSTSTTEKDYVENKEIKDAMEVYEEEDYEEFIHTIFSILETQELLDILSE